MNIIYNITCSAKAQISIAEYIFNLLKGLILNNIFTLIIIAGLFITLAVIKYKKEAEKEKKRNTQDLP